MKRILISCVALAAFAAPAFAGPPTTAPEGGVAGTTSANTLANDRSLDPLYGSSIFGGRSQGGLGAIQPDVANPNVNPYGEPAGPYGQVILQDGYWNGDVSWTAH
jgi:hypothetical protein